MGEPRVKAVWFVTARRHVVERHGRDALDAIVARMPEPSRAALAEPLASTWCLHYAGFPFFSDPSYRLFVARVLTKVTELCTARRPRVRVTAHGKDSLDVEVAYG